ncbi:helix-turn-helix domain-containing protein [Micromonospora craniellae]|uniref:DNA-binding protein n=1 Tax=Micromonospora craniellae TaxID=2294034 RepID=A0A372FR85_9ACTN|nr:helix-turn-helix domain-containing protein [Micromonospora craniellae]QOC94394.1 helix-turn-helix domain-containing protein [Micromonospora craniellae]RFS43208.1 DNA-binding protein [Micromonospora craniellae]
MSSDRPSTSSSTTSTSGSGAWSLDKVRALGTTTDVATAGAIFGLSRSSAYELARSNRLPIPVMKIGSRYRVSVPAIIAVLTATKLDRPPQVT